MDKNSECVGYFGNGHVKMRNGDVSLIKEIPLRYKEATEQQNQEAEARALLLQLAITEDLRILISPGRAGTKIFEAISQGVRLNI